MAATAQLPQHLHTVHIGQAEIENYGVVRNRRRGSKRLLPEPDSVYGEAATPQLVGDQIAHRMVILDEQHPHNFFRSSGSLISAGQPDTTLTPQATFPGATIRQPRVSYVMK